MQKLRTFIAIDTPPDIKRKMGELRDHLMEAGADVRWESDEKLHCTIKFLGDTDPAQLDEITRSVERVATTVRPMTVRYRAIGSFPNLMDPRVVWIGMEESGTNLSSLQRGIEDSLAPLGFAREERPFHPHVTLGRVKTRRNIVHLLRMIESVTFETGPASLNDVLLVRSELKPTGSVYTTLKSIPLTA